MNNYINNIEELKNNKYNLRAIEKLNIYKIKNSVYSIKLNKENLITVLYNNKPQHRCLLRVRETILQTMDLRKRF